MACLYGVVVALRISARVTVSGCGSRSSPGFPCCARVPRALSRHCPPRLPVIGSEEPTTGGVYDFSRPTTSLTEKQLDSPKKVTLVRHGLSSWNEESGVQGSSNLSVLTEAGVRQAEGCRNALSNINFDKCFSSPISRAKSTAEVIWQGREEMLVFLDSLKEAHLYFLEGMRNVDARKIYLKEYRTWREDLANFCVNGVYPIRKLWETSREAWKEILQAPGGDFLVVTTNRC